jgi:DHA3 family macrolide efflux protein-like MFS transporter
VSQSMAPRGMKTFLIIWLGQLISIVGSGLTAFALGVWIFGQTGQVTPFALTVLFGTLPRILLTPVAGSLADRLNRRWMMILADTGSALVTLVVVLLLFADRLAVWHIYLVSLAGAVFAAFQEPAYATSIIMLVPKKDLGRANGMIQMGQAIECLLSPILAGVLFGIVGITGIILIDFATYFFAIGALLRVHIPQPKALATDTGEQPGAVWRDLLFGWRYLTARAGLFNLLLYFALVNFLLNFAAVLIGPLVLSFGTANTLGVVQTVSGVGMLAGSIIMSAWGGPKRRILGVIGFATLAACGLLLMGFRSSALFVGGGLLLLLFCVPLASGPSQAIFQTKIAPAVQGRVFGARRTLSQSMKPLAFLISGPLADYVFEPWMSQEGALAHTFIGGWIGTGPGRGIGLMMVIAGLGLILVSVLAFANPRVRRVEDELADAIIDVDIADGSPRTEPAGPESVSVPAS